MTGHELSSPLVVSFGIFITLLLIAIIYLFFANASRSEKIVRMEEEHAKLMRSFNELDEQAKLIVRTDLELNKAQEELDKRLNGINALQRTSRQISQALNEKEVYQKLSSTLFNELGFSYALLVSLENNTILPWVNIGFAPKTAASILSKIETDEHLKTAFKESHAFSSLNTSRKSKEKLVSIFECEHFILAPILTQNGIMGFIFVGNQYTAPSITQGDEELIGILASQIGQSIENARLFEKVFHSSQELELKVKERTKQLAQALEQVEEINQKKSEFISAVSHELRTPLTSIKGYAAILIAGKIGEVPPAVKERLSKINSHSDNLVSLINNLLDIARIESGKVEMKFNLTPAKALIDNVADLLIPQLKDKEIKLVTDIAPGVAEVYVDHSQAERVLINLLSNAIKFTPRQGTITIAAAKDPEADFVHFNVSDTGIGIPPDALKKLFNEFYRVDNEINQNVKGTGLGLTLAKNIVEAHHGTIDVKSQVGLGTTFTFTLPSSLACYTKSKSIKTVI